MNDTSPQAFIISNPRAGRNQFQAMKKLRSLGIVFQLEQTQGPGHAEALALQASQEGYRFIIAVGGDGTIHEVLNGMLRNPKNQSVLGWITAGTANDYAASFARDALLCLNGLNECPVCVDVGCIKWDGHVRYFANVAGIGLSGAVAASARTMSRLPARFKYSVALLRQLGATYGPRELSIAIDEESMGPLQKALLLSVAIGKREGSFTLHPDADVSDGLFDLLQLGPLSRWELVWHFQALQRGILPTHHPKINRTRCRRIEIKSGSPMAIHLDGESPSGSQVQGLKEFTIEVLPQAISCLAIPHRPLSIHCGPTNCRDRISLRPDGKGLDGELPSRVECDGPR